MKTFLLFWSFYCTCFMSFSQAVILDEPIRYLALGDSYTKGESVSTELNFPNQLFTRLSDAGYTTESIQIIAQTGWRTDNLADGIEQANLSPNYNLVSLLIGVNNQYQNIPFETYAPDFEALLDSAIRFAGGNKAHVFVVSIPDYAYTPFGNQNNTISTAIDQYNASNKSIAEAYGITYFDITPISREGIEQPDLVANDGLHPSALMYSRWVDLFMEHIQSNNVLSRSNEVDLQSLQVFPNPNSQLLKMHIPQHLYGERYEIHNALGIPIHQGTFTQKEEIISTASWSHGFYQIHIPNKQMTLNLLVH